MDTNKDTNKDTAKGDDKSVDMTNDKTSDTAGSADVVAKAPAPQVWPTLRAGDARKLIRFLVDAFGFEETAVYGEGERVDHAELSWPEGGGIMLGSVRAADESDKWSLRPGCFGAYVVTADPDAVHARAKGAGAEIIDELHETEYGSRDFAARDPEGNRWSFGTYAGEPRKTAGRG